MGGQLHDAAGHAGLGSQLGGQTALRLEAQHVARSRCQQHAGALQRHHTAGFQHGDPAAQGLGFFQVMCRQQHRVPRLVQAGDELPQRLAQFDVDTGRGLVQHDHRRLVDQRLGHQHAPLHSAGELSHVGTSFIGQAQALQQFVDPGFVVLDTKVARLDAQCFTHIEERIEHQFLRHHTELPPRFGVVGLHVLAKHLDAARGRPRQTSQDTDQGGLAGAVGTEQAEEFTLFDVETHVVQCLERTTRGNKVFGDGLERNRWHGSRRF